MASDNASRFKPARIKNKHPKRFRPDSPGSGRDSPNKWLPKRFRSPGAQEALRAHALFEDEFENVLGQLDVPSPDATTSPRQQFLVAVDHLAKAHRLTRAWTATQWVMMKTTAAYGDMHDAFLETARHPQEVQKWGDVAKEWEALEEVFLQKINAQAQAVGFAAGGAGAQQFLGALASFTEYRSDELEDYQEVCEPFLVSSVDPEVVAKFGDIPAAWRALETKYLAALKYRIGPAAAAAQYEKKYLAALKNRTAAAAADAQ
jgi:hypothetical protein